MPSTSISAKLSAVTVNGTSLPIQDASLNADKSLQEATDSTSGGWTQNIVGNRSATVDVTAAYKSDNIGQMPDYFLNTTFDSEVTLRLTLASGVGYYEGPFMVASVNTSAPVRGAGEITAQVQFRSNGPLTFTAA